MEKEKEYRDTAIVIAQVGIGIGGMVLGLVGLLLSLIIPMFTSSPTVQDQKELSTPNVSIKASQQRAQEVVKPAHTNKKTPSAKEDKQKIIKR